MSASSFLLRFFKTAYYEICIENQLRRAAGSPGSLCAAGPRQGEAHSAAGCRAQGAGAPPPHSSPAGTARFLFTILSCNAAQMGMPSSQQSRKKKKKTICLIRCNFSHAIPAVTFLQFSADKTEAECIDRACNSVWKTSANSSNKEEKKSPQNSPT